MLRELKKGYWGTEKTSLAALQLPADVFHATAVSEVVMINRLVVARLERRQKTQSNQLWNYQLRDYHDKAKQQLGKRRDGKFTEKEIVNNWVLTSKVNLNCVLFILEGS